MTVPGALGYGAPTDAITALVRQVEDLRRTVAAMQTQLVNNGNLTVPNGSTITIQNGGTATVLDASGNTVATLGTVGGVSSVHAQDPGTGESLPISQLAFAPAGANDGGSSFTQTTINTWQAGPMSITVQVNTGRLYVEAGAVITVVGTASSSTQAVMSWNISGPTNVGPALTRGYGAGVINPSSPVVPGFGQASRGYMHTGLAAGTYTITDQYQTNISGSSYVGRSLFVIPF